MKATLEFNLPEDADAHRIAVKASDTHDALQALDESLRRFIKHGHDFKTADEAMRCVRADLAPLLE